MTKFEEGHVKIESYVVKMSWENLERLVKHIQKNPLGLVFKVVIDNQIFDI